MKKSFLGIVFAAVACCSAGAAAKEILPIGRTDTNSVTNASTVSAECEARTASRSVFDHLSPALIEFYEVNIAGEKLISDMKPQKLAALAKRLKIDENKLKAILILQDLAARQGEKLDIKTLAATGDKDLIILTKTHIKNYIASLTPEQKAKLDAAFNEMRKK